MPQLKLNQVGISEAEQYFSPVLKYESLASSVLEICICRNKIYIYQSKSCSSALRKEGPIQNFGWHNFVTDILRTDADGNCQGLISCVLNIKLLKQIHALMTQARYISDLNNFF